MRKNLERTYTAWLAGKPAKPSPSISTDGETIYSYATAILTRDSDGVVILSDTSYSPTTNSQQHGLRVLLSRTATPYVSVEPTKRGVMRDDLLTLALPTCVGGTVRSW